MRLRSLSAIVAGSLVIAAAHGGAQELFKVPQLVPSTPDSSLQAQPFGPVKPTENESLFSLTYRVRREARVACYSGRVLPATPEVDPKFLKRVPDEFFERAPDDKRDTMRMVPTPPCVVPGSRMPAPAQNTR